jgi:uncharacterized SAM-binding protein YcdF (DUF218 family)
LVVSGGAPLGSTPSAIGYARLARELGVDDSSIVVLDKAPDTAAEARDIASTLGPTEFVLVTSAYHMPRAMKLMLRAGRATRAYGDDRSASHRWRPEEVGARTSRIPCPHCARGAARLRA